MIEVRVPASSANLGPGFDSFGIALSLYNTIRVKETEKGLYITNSDTLEFVPTNTNNLIYRAVLRVFDEVGYTMRGLMINQNSDIPMTRGLGSSSACIVGGLIAGNILSGRHLTSQRLFELATEIEGHPDNVAPALFGGFCISCRDEQRLIRQTIRLKSDIKFVAMVPKYFVSTKKSRGLIPKEVPIENAAFNISHASSIVYAFATGNYDGLSVFCKDRLHQPYRAEVVLDMDEIIKKSMENGAYCAYLSGSGPTVVAMVSSDNGSFVNKMNEAFKSLGIERSCIELTCDNVGAVAILSE